MMHYSERRGLGADLLAKSAAKAVEKAVFLDRRVTKGSDGGERGQKKSRFCLRIWALSEKVRERL